MRDSPPRNPMRERPEGRAKDSDFLKTSWTDVAALGILAAAVVAIVYLLAG